MERFLDYFVPEKYKLNLAIDKSKKSIGGVVAVRGIAKAKTIKFHAVNLKIESVLVDDKKTEFSCKNNVLEITEVTPGKHEIKIEYNGRLNENMQGAYLSTYEYNGKTEIIVATQFESHYAREAFPCIDEPAAKAVFELTITAGKDDLILTNTPEVSEKHRWCFFKNF